MPLFPTILLFILKIAKEWWLAGIKGHQAVQKAKAKAKQKRSPLTSTNATEDFSVDGYENDDACGMVLMDESSPTFLL